MLLYPWLLIAGLFFRPAQRSNHLCIIYPSITMAYPYPKVRNRARVERGLLIFAGFTTPSKHLVWLHSPIIHKSYKSPSNRQILLPTPTTPLQLVSYELLRIQTIFVPPTLAILARRTRWAPINDRITEKADHTCQAEREKEAHYGHDGADKTAARTKPNSAGGHSRSDGQDKESELDESEARLNATHGKSSCPPSGQYHQSIQWPQGLSGEFSQLVNR